MTNTIKYKNYDWKYTRKDLHFCPRCASPLKLEDLHIVNQPQLICDHCQFIFYLDPKIAVTAVVLRQDSVLLLKRAEEPGKGKWGLPGGYASRGESLILAIANEVSEEAGIGFMNKGILDCLDLPDGQGLQIIFWGEAEGNEPRPNVESSEARFFEASCIPWDDLAFESTHLALRKSSLCQALE